MKFIQLKTKDGHDMTVNLRHVQYVLASSPHVLVRMKDSAAMYVTDTLDQVNQKIREALHPGEYGD